MLQLNIHSWRHNVIDSRIRDLLTGQFYNKFWLAGGAAKSIYNKEEILDYDLFFTSPSVKLDVERELQEMGFRTVFKCPADELITLKNGQMKVQLVTKKFYDGINDLLMSFDLTPSMFAYDGEFLYTYRNCIKDVKKKRLGLNIVTYPVATINRVAKYMKKGYSYTEDFGTQLVSEINTGIFDGDQLALYID